MGNWFSDLGDSLSTFFTDLFTNLGTFFGDLWTNLSSAFTSLGTNIGNFFSSLWANIGNAFQGIFTWFGDFFEGLKNLFIRIFVPADNFFTNKIDDTKSKVAEKIPYDDYVTIFEDMENVGETSSNTRSLKANNNKDNVNMNGYQIGGMTFNMPNFIDLSFITQFKDTWYSWVRAFTFIALVIYNINQVIKLLRGYSVAEGVGQIASNNITGGGKE